MKPTLPPRHLLLAALLALAAGGCREDPVATPAAAAGNPDAVVAADAVADATAPVPPPELGQFKVASVLLGTALDADQIVIGDRESFAGKDRILASVLSTGEHPGLSLSARWMAPDGSTIAETAQALAPAGPTATTFSLANPDGLPAGEYRLSIAANGHPLQTRRFRVEEP